LKTRCHHHQPCHENHHWLHEIHTSSLLTSPSRNRANANLKGDVLPNDGLELKHLLHEALNSHPWKCLKSRDSLIDSASLAPDPNFPSEYMTSQCSGQLRKFIEVSLPHVPGYDLPRKTWVCLNRVRTACGKTYDTRNRFGPRRSLNCDCGHPRQTLDHLMKCPLVIPVDFADLKCVNARAV